MNFQKLKYAVAVADSGSFREAARRLYMAQSSLSTAIKELEEEYQIQIFERTKRGVVITEEGSEFLSYARAVLTQVESLEKHYREPAGRKLFSVSAQHYDFASQAFSLLVNQDDDLDEEWDYRFLETDTLEVMEDVRTAYSELGILLVNDNNQKVIDQYLQRHELQFTELGQFTPMVFLGRNHPLSYKKRVKMEDLADFPMIRFEQAKGATDQYSEEAAFERVPGQSVIYVSDRASAINLLMETRAYLIGSGLVASPFREVEIILPLETDELSSIGYIKARYRKLSTAAKDYIDLLEHCLNPDEESADSPH